MRRAVIFLAPVLLSACTGGGPDMGPVGGGLATIGLGIVVAAFIVALSGKGGRHE